jgi:hypothetical protein
VAAHCRAALDACISRIEQTMSRGRASSIHDRDGAEVAAVMAGMLRGVEASVAADRSCSRRQLVPAQAAPQAAGAAAGHPVCFACERGGSWVGDGTTPTSIRTYGTDHMMKDGNLVMHAPL